MALPKFVSDSVGSWSGTMSLHRSWLTGDRQVSVSDSTLHIDSDPVRKIGVISYRWSVDGKQEEGSMLLAGNGKALQMGWVDTWHQDSGVLHLVGAEHEPQSFKLKGTYDAEGQTWGWSISFSRQGEKLHVDMENISPDGEAEWAVKAEYRQP